VLLLLISLSLEKVQSFLVVCNHQQQLELVLPVPQQLPT